jgi:hypothetical protein
MFCIQHNILGQDTIAVAKHVRSKDMTGHDTVALAKHVKPKDKTRQDTVDLSRYTRPRFKPEPLKATMMAVAFPGLGQIYNRKVWKIPLVYAGFGGLIYSARFNGREYNSYMKAYQDFTDDVKSTDSYLKVIPSSADRTKYDPLYNPTGYDLTTYTYYKDAMLEMVDYYKRYRDLSYIGIAGWYLLSILDANVDASLFNYDISSDLNVTFVPVQMSLPGGYVGAGLSVNLTINF